MDNHSESKNSNLSLKVAIAILAVLLVGSLFYMYKMSNDSVAVEKNLISEKEFVMNELQELKKTYDAAIAEKTSLSEELIAEREKVEKLIADLQKSKGDIVSLSKYKEDFRKLEGRMKSLIAENDLLKQQNLQLVVERDSTIVELNQAKKYNDTLIVQNENLSKTVEIASALSVLNLKVEAIKERSSGKQIITDKASRANKLKVCFTIAENKVAKSGDKMYYVQIIGAKGIILGEKKTVDFGDQSLTYSFTSLVRYKNKTTDVCELLNADEDFEKGTYFVNVFDNKTLVSKPSFSLR